MPRLRDLYVPNREKLTAEYWRARDQTLRESNVRLIANPKGAAAVSAVLDQIPRVKADLRRNDRD